MKTRIFNVGLHQINFSQAFPLFDGKCLKRKDEWLRMIKWCLKQLGYSFDHISRPIPALMVNWMCIDRKFLRKWMIKVLEQMETIDDGILRLCYLDLNGFSFKAPDGSSHSVVRLILQADGYRQEVCTTICLASKICERFMNTNFRNKIIVIN